MFAIIETGGKQYKVTEGTILEVEKLDKQVGDKVNLNVLMTADGDKIKTGSPLLKDAVCTAEVLAHGRAGKIIVFKYKPKIHERKTQGHRQPFTKIKILSIK